MDRRDFLRNLFRVAAYSQVAGLADTLSDDVNADKRSGSGVQITRRPYKKTGMTLPLLGFGMMRFPGKDGVIDLAAAEKMIGTALERGCNYFDTAYIYPGSEEVVGKVLAKYTRNSYYLTSKMPIHQLKSEADLDRIFREQLRRTRAGYFDFYFMHWLNAEHWEMAKTFHVWDFLEKQKAEGRIRRIGFSFHDEPELLREIAQSHPWELVQIQLNYLDWEVYRAREMYESLTQLDIPVAVMEPLKGGSLVKLTESSARILTDADPERSIASWGLRYAASLPNVQVILSGMSSLEQMEDNLRTFTNFTPLTEVERQTLADALEEYRKTSAVPCTGCRYCRPCPKGVDIPRNIALHNQVKAGTSVPAAGMVYYAMRESERASNCVGCGVCQSRCPQKLKIPDLMREIGAEFRSC